MTSDKGSHVWSFYRAGGVDQVRFDSGADLAHLGSLDQKLWMALSCPVKGLEFDERTLALLDSDADGCVRAPELIAAAEWTCSLLKNPDDLLKGREVLPLAAIAAETPEGKQLLASARHILASLGKREAAEISIEEAMNTKEIFAKAVLNGDGFVPPEFIEDEQVRKAAQEVVDCLGGENDRSGKPGISQVKVDAFFDAARAFDGWWKKAEADSKSVLPLGEKTAAAHAALRAVAAKVDDYFGRCRLAAYDGRALQALNREEAAYLTVAAKDFTITAAEVAGFPLAAVEAAKGLPLEGAVNPAWSAAIAALRDAVVRPLLGKEKKALSDAEWTALKERLAPFEAWQAGKEGGAVEKLGVGRVRALLASDAKAKLEAVIAKDLAVAPQVEAMTKVERLARLHRDLYPLARNYVSFVDFYARKPSIFQSGTLYLDARACTLCVQVLDGGKHALLAGMSKAYLAYVDCRRHGEAPMTVACAFTAGDSDNLFVGRNGVFYDRRGRDWNATITKIVDNPISIRQAFWAPYKKVLRFLEAQAAKRAAAADDASTAKLQTTATATGAAAAAGTAPAKSKFDVGVIAALGVAVGGIAAVLSGVVGGFLGLGAYMPLGVVGLLLLISGPSMLIAWLKLRQRNLGPILDANGWAVNALAKVNIPLGTALTERAVLPPGSHRTLVDPYAPKKSLWWRLFRILLLLAAIGYGLHKSGLPHKWRPDLFPDPSPAPAATPGK
ncbi:MAG: hypothetical protein ACT4PV_10575 [Planctomycetaceae bacterium]